MNISKSEDRQTGDKGRDAAFALRQKKPRHDQDHRQQGEPDVAECFLRGL